MFFSYWKIPRPLIFCSCLLWTIPFFCPNQTSSVPCPAILMDVFKLSSVSLELVVKMKGASRRIRVKSRWVRWKQMNVFWNYWNSKPIKIRLKLDPLQNKKLRLRSPLKSAASLSSCSGKCCRTGQAGGLGFCFARELQTVIDFNTAPQALN